MVLTLIFIALLQDPDLEAQVARLENQDATVRENAAKELIKRGPGIVPKILAFHRSTTSTEFRSTAFVILRQFPFTAFVGTREDEPLHNRLKEVLLDDLDAHRSTTDCWLEKKKQPTLQASKLRIRRQTGSGHGQTLELEEYLPDGKGGLTICRIAYERSAPWAEVKKEESVRVEEARMEAEETKALAALLMPPIALREKCAIGNEDEADFWSSVDFTRRIQIQSADKSVWSAAFTGYVSSRSKKDYVHGKVIDRILNAALSDRTWNATKLTADGRAGVLLWIVDNYSAEEWWVKRRYVAIARLVGDETYLPFLRKIATELEGKAGDSEKYQLKIVLDAIAWISAAKH